MFSRRKKIDLLRQGQLYTTRARVDEVSDAEVFEAIQRCPRHFASNKIWYKGADLFRGRSPLIWATFPWEEINEDPNEGGLLFDDFKGWTDVVASNNGNATGDMGGWYTWEATTTASIVGLASDQLSVPSGQGANTSLGAIRLNTVTTAHNTVMFQHGKASGSWGVNATAGALPKLFFEARVRFNTAGGANTADYFVGLATGGLCTANNTLITTADAFVTTKNLIGFSSLNSGTINSIYGAAAAPTTQNSAGAIPSTLTNWTKLGFLWDPTRGSNNLQFFQDGVLLGSVTGQPASNWPTAVGMTPTILLQLGGTGTTSVNFDVDWIAVGAVCL